MATAPAPLITGVDFVAIPTHDIEAAMHFYGTVLGLPFVALDLHHRYGGGPA